eukprot:CAMPEP_0184671874 /NCGR_PEP_ID=MMETSP0308-20130426/85763_1 /TAXON_ID=38269 /ORGANISM="Gloeochaete witrockiana, Strain SAG 46.84" /LENGTH=452 /DNA_ID=CAMNT_0027119091 /DNA_START=146 /DNA_END=1501 /DNA_ORIENTATION=-
MQSRKAAWPSLKNAIIFLFALSVSFGMGVLFEKYVTLEKSQQQVWTRYEESNDVTMTNPTTRNETNTSVPSHERRDDIIVTATETADVISKGLPPSSSSTSSPPPIPAFVSLPKGRKGRWVPFKGPVPGLNIKRYRKCKALVKNEAGDADRINQMQSWQWESLSPDLDALKLSEVFGSAKSCLSKKTILFIGDSLSRQAHHSAVCMLDAVGHETNEELSEQIVTSFANERHTLKHQECWRFESLGNARLCYLLNNWIMADLRSPARFRDHGIDMDRELDFSRLGGLSENWLRRSPRPDVLVISSGTWYVGDPGKPEVWIPRLRRALRAMLDRVAELFDTRVLMTKVTYVIYRTLSQNHIQGGNWVSGGSCTQDAPAQHPGPDLYGKSFTSLFWENGTMDRANEVLYEEIARRPPTYRYWVLDGQAVAKERWDTHPRSNDCLHFVLPSVPDLW